uniref:DNA-(apurinic or apyrimidinic site) endonuclease 2 n=1 Tax=Kalanchoe fedtschenkoi TaxID=63787 RepID=A0A7N0UBW0_KALFE
MKIVTYNVNGLRPRIAQHGSLLKLLDSLDADIVCFQETKLSRHELTSDLVMANGYESFVSCTRTSGPGRVAYSGVATFCRTKSAFSSTEVALPVEAEEGFTGLVQSFRRNGSNTTCKASVVHEGLENFDHDELLKVDSEGRCIVTDHGHFVLFNLYGPRAGCDDAERIQFKLTFYQALQKRWEILLHQGRRIIVVGDLNIAPAAIDRCEAGPDFEENEFRKWLRSMFVENGGSFYDVFRSKHPERREAYTCWSQSTGAEEFNYGSRIDHILTSGACLHQGLDQEDHDFLTCHVDQCDIMTQFKRWKPGVSPRWNGGRNTKLEGSDHAPVFMKLIEIPGIPSHSTPPLSSRYAPGVRGLQQTIVSSLLKRQETDQAKEKKSAVSLSEETSTMCSYAEKLQMSLSSSSLHPASVGEADSLRSLPNSQQTKTLGESPTKKRPRKSRGMQLSLKSFFQKCSNNGEGVLDSADKTCSEAAIKASNPESIGRQEEEKEEMNHALEPISGESTSNQGLIKEAAQMPAENNTSGSALLEWQRIQQMMQSSIPMCKGHKEACVPRVVKKAGPTFGRRFYVCARPEGPSSNPEANCGYFKWAASTSKPK